MKNIFSVCLALLISSLYASAQISITSGSLNYSQDFNTLGSPANPASLSIPHWQLVEYGTGNAADNKYIGGTGSSNTGNAYSFGAQNSTERALGGVRSQTTAPMFGASFINNTGAAITNVFLQCVGEQWRVGTTTFHADSLIFQYSLVATGVGDTVSAWTTVNSLLFTSPVTTATTIGAVNGNANSLILPGNVNVNIPAGSQLWIRWVDYNVTGSDDGLAIDDFMALFTAGNPTVSISAAGNPACAGSNVSLTASVPAGTTPGLQWRINGQILPGATTSSFVYTSWNNGDIVDLSVTPSGGTPYITNAITINRDSNLVWTGGAGNNLWHSPGNWSCGAVPTAVDNVTIPSGAGVVVNDAAVCFNLNVSVGSSVSFSGTSPFLHVYNTAINNGTINTGAGSIQVDQP